MMPYSMLDAMNEPRQVPVEKRYERLLEKSRGLAKRQELLRGLTEAEPLRLRAEQTLILSLRNIFGRSEEELARLRPMDVLKEFSAYVVAGYVATAEAGAENISEEEKFCEFLRALKEWWWYEIIPLPRTVHDRMNIEVERREAYSRLASCLGDSEASVFFSEDAKLWCPTLIDRELAESPESTLDAPVIGICEEYRHFRDSNPDMDKYRELRCESAWEAILDRVHVGIIGDYRFHVEECLLEIGVCLRVEKNRISAKEHLAREMNLNDATVRAAWMECQGEGRVGDGSLLEGKEYVTSRRAAQYLGVGIRTIQKAVKEGSLDATGVGTKRQISTKSLRARQAPLK